MNVLVPHSNRLHHIVVVLIMYAEYFEESLSSVTDLIRIIISTTSEEEAAMQKTVAKQSDTLTLVAKGRVRIVTSDGDEFGNF